MTVTTTAEGGCVASNGKPQEFPWPIPGGATLAVVLLMAVPRRRCWNRWLVLVLLLADIVAGLSACGSHTSKSTCTAYLPPTTAGTYTITVTGTSGSIMQTTTVTLTVQ